MLLIKLSVLILLTTSIYAQDSSDNILTDVRDNNVYSIVKIGDQIWMQENLRYHHISAYYPPKKKKKIKKFGQFYTNIALEELCPIDYSIPTRTDWDVLISELSKIGNINPDSITTEILEKDTNTTEDYITYITEDKSALLKLFDLPILLKDYGCIQNKKRNKRVQTANLWVIDDIDGSNYYHYHISSNKMNKHTHKHHVEDTENRIRYFSVRCI